MTSDVERAIAHVEWKALLESNSPAPVTLGTLLQFMDVVKQTITRKHAELIVRVEELEKRPVSGVSYSGTFDSSKEYGAGTLVTKAGALWLCLRTTCGESPGSSGSWRLVVKNGGAA